MARRPNSCHLSWVGARARSVRRTTLPNAPLGPGAQYRPGNAMMCGLLTRNGGQSTARWCIPSRPQAQLTRYYGRPRPRMGIKDPLDSKFHSSGRRMQILHQRKAQVGPAAPGYDTQKSLLKPDACQRAAAVAAIGRQPYVERRPACRCRCPSSKLGSTWVEGG